MVHLVSVNRTYNSTQPTIPAADGWTFRSRMQPWHTIRRYHKPHKRPKSTKRSTSFAMVMIGYLESYGVCCFPCLHRQQSVPTCGHGSSIIHIMLHHATPSKRGTIAESLPSFCDGPKPRRQCLIPAGSPVECCQGTPWLCASLGWTAMFTMILIDTYAVGQTYTSLKSYMPWYHLILTWRVISQ